MFNLVRKVALELMFQPLLNKLKPLIRPQVHSTVVRLLNHGRVKEAHELITEELVSNELEQFEERWMRRIQFFNGPENAERLFKKYMPAFYFYWR